MKEHQIKDDKFADSTEAFEDVGHSMDARDLMAKYLIGKLTTGVRYFLLKIISSFLNSI